MGVGAPPSAKEEVDTALRSSRVATIKRTIFFIEESSVGWQTQLGNTIFFLEEEIRSVRKTRDDKCASRRYTDKMNRRPGWAKPVP